MADTARAVATADDYGYWRAKLDGLDPDPPADRTQLPCGFWRLRSGEPLAVWLNELGIRIAMCGFSQPYKLLSNRQMETMAEGGSFGVAVEEEAYRAACEVGRWPDTDAVVADQVRPPSLGHNQGPTDEAEILREQIEAAKAGAFEYAKIEDDETAARAQSLRSRLTELAGKADKKRKAEKQPHLEAGKAVDAKWNPIVEAGEDAAKLIRNALSKWETEKLRRERAAEEERRRVERESGITEAEIDRSQAVLGAILGEPPEPAPPPKAQIKGGYGRAAAVKLVKVVTEVTDQDALYGFLKTHGELKDLMRKLAQRAVDAGHTVPGVTVEEQRKVA